MHDRFGRFIREDMERRGFCLLMSRKHEGALRLVFTDKSAWGGPCAAIPVVITDRDMADNSTPEAIAAIVRKRCAVAADAYKAMVTA